MSDAPAVVTELEGRFGADAFTAQETRCGFPTLWTSRERLSAVLKFLKTEVDRPFGTLYDLTAIDERFRRQRDGPARQRFHRPLPPALLRAERGPVHQGAGERRRRLPAHGDGPVALGQLVRARGLGHVRRPLRRTPFAAPHPHAAHLGGAPSAQGAPGPGHRDGSVRASRRAPGPGAGGASLPARGLGHEAHPRGHRFHVPQRRAPASRHPRRHPHRPAARRRGDRRLPARDRLPPPGRGEDGGAAVLALLHPLYGPHRLPGRGHEQPGLRPVGGAAWPASTSPIAPR